MPNPFKPENSDTESSSLQRGYNAMQQNRMAEGIKWFTKAVQETPKNTEAIACLGQSLIWQGDYYLGIRQLRIAAGVIAKRARKSKEISDLLAIIEQLQANNDYSGSLQFIQLAVQIMPKDARGFQLLAMTYQRLNQRKNALLANQQALKLAPNKPMLEILQASLEADNGRYPQSKKRLENILQTSSLNAEEQFRTHKGMARILDKLGEYQHVFMHLHSAAKLANQLPEVQQLDPDLVLEMIAINKAGFNPALLNRWSDTRFANSHPAPVFLCGFLRSGTTLIQEALDTHPQVLVADEADLISAIRSELDRLCGPLGNTPEQLNKLEADDIEHLRQFYWQRVEKRYGKVCQQQLFIDKTSLNTIDLGLINCVFPDAKVLFMLRDPRDVCISCFMQLLAFSPTTIQFINWKSTKDFYCQTMDWWQYFKVNTSLAYKEYRYENAVSHFEATFRDIFSFLGLNWDPVVTNFHQHAAKKFIASPSFSQVAQPLYASSLARWKHYQTDCASISHQLQPFIRAFGYES